MEREACVCDHGFERSDLCAEITRPSEHPPVRGEKISKRLLGGIIGCKDKTSS